MNLQEIAKEKDLIHKETQKLSKEYMIGNISDNKKKEILIRIEKNNGRLIELTEIMRNNNRKCNSPI